MTPQQILDAWHVQRAVRLAQYSTRHAIRRLRQRARRVALQLVIAERKAARPAGGV